MFITAEPKKLMVPTVHLNGTSRDGLMTPIMEALTALRVARAAMASTMPNGRDYYPQGADAAVTATDQHFDRMRRLDALIDEYQTIGESLP